MKTGFRTKVFVGAFAAAALSLLALAALLAWQVRDAAARRRSSGTSATRRGSSPTCSRRPRPLDDAGPRSRGRSTRRSSSPAASRSSPSDGRVVGDSTQTESELPLAREPPLAPRGGRRARARVRQQPSDTARPSSTDMLYVAVRASHPVVTLRAPGAAADRRRRAAGRDLASDAGRAGRVDPARAGRRRGSSRRRWRDASARSRGSRNAIRRAISPRPTYDYGADELGTVARALDASVQQLGGRIEELSRDRARMEAILSGMVEGVLVVDRQGRLQLVNRAAQEMLRVEPSATGRPYLEVIRHPDIAAQLTAALQRRGDRQPGADAGARPGPDVRHPRRAGRPGRAAAPCSCCTTSPICAAPIRSGATSSPTCRTSCARR